MNWRSRKRDSWIFLTRCNSEVICDPHRNMDKNSRLGHSLQMLWRACGVNYYIKQQLAIEFLYWTHNLRKNTLPVYNLTDLDVPAISTLVLYTTFCPRDSYNSSNPNAPDLWIWNQNVIRLYKYKANYYQTAKFYNFTYLVIDSDCILLTQFVRLCLYKQIHRQ